MSRRPQHRAWEVITASALLFTLLLVLVPHPHYLAVVPACPMLAVVFLFGAVYCVFALASIASER